MNSTSTSAADAAIEETEPKGLARLRRITQETLKKEGGWSMSQSQMACLFGKEGLFMQRGIFGISRTQNLLKTPVLPQALNLAGFGTCSFKQMLRGQMAEYVRPFTAFKDEAGFSAVCRRDDELTKIRPDSLREQCIADTYPLRSSSEHRFYLFPVEKLEWKGDTLKATKSRLVPDIPQDAVVPSLGLVLSYVQKALDCNAPLPRYIFVQHALLPGTEHKPNASYQILIQPYEEKQITLIEGPIPKDDIADEQGGRILREYYLKSICDMVRLDRAVGLIGDYARFLDFGDDIVLWTGIMSSSGLFRDIL